MSLPAKQQRFVDEYLVDRNATQAAIRAGYGIAGAHVAGARLLRNGKVRAEIDARGAQQTRKLDLRADRVLQGFQNIAETDLADVMEWGVKEVAIPYDEEGRQLPATEITNAAAVRWADQPYARPFNSADLPPHVRAAIAEVSIGKDGTLRIKLHNKVDALTQLGRHLALFTDKSELSGGITVEVRRYSDDQEG